MASSVAQVRDPLEQTGVLLPCVLGLSLAETMAAGHRCKMMNPEKYCLSGESRHSLRKNLDAGMGK